MRRRLIAIVLAAVFAVATPLGIVHANADPGMTDSCADILSGTGAISLGSRTLSFTEVIGDDASGSFDGLTPHPSCPGYDYRLDVYAGPRDTFGTVPLLASQTVSGDALAGSPAIGFSIQLPAPQPFVCVVAENTKSGSTEVLDRGPDSGCRELQADEIKSLLGEPGSNFH